MVTKKKQDSSSLSIMDAVETLTSIADMEFPREIVSATPEEIVAQNNMITARAIQWVKSESKDSTIKLIRETFKVILAYLKDFYKNKDQRNTEAFEGVKTIMVLAGEAAKKIDKYTTLFKETKNKSVSKIKEYRKLQEFYLSRISRRIDDSMLGKWILELTKGAMARVEKEEELEAAKRLSAKHVFIDLESVKKDSDYELFLLRKEDGTRFFNPRLIRNIKLVCDFGEGLRGEREIDPLEKIYFWQDQAIQVAASEILYALRSPLDTFIREAKWSYRKELVGDLNKALVALVMASNVKNHLSNNPVKSCKEYFQDFLYFLRSALRTDEYQHLIVYPPKRKRRLIASELELIHTICRALFTSIKDYKEIVKIFEPIYREFLNKLSREHMEAATSNHTLWSRLGASYAAMSKLIKTHPFGPLVKVLEVLEQGAYHGFDPLAQFNIPSILYAIYIQEKKISNLRMPAPIYQESIDRAQVLEEFKGFLRSYAKGQSHNHHLVINLQDRTSWKEHSRCAVLEDLQYQEQFDQCLTVATMTKDTEFYHQLAPFEKDNHAHTFMEHFKQNLEDESCGFYFPRKIRERLFFDFIDGVMHAIHRVFFGHKNVLSKEERLNFIEIYYLFLQLKMIELVHPETFSLVCKDGIDISGTANAQFYAFLKILHEDQFRVNDVERLDMILFTTPIMIRERIIMQERFNRMLNALKKIESTKKELGTVAFKKLIHQAFDLLFKPSSLGATAVYIP